MVVHIRGTEYTGITVLFCIHSGELSKALHIDPSSFMVAMREEEAVVLGVACIVSRGSGSWSPPLGVQKTCQARQEKQFQSLRPLMVGG